MRIAINTRFLIKNKLEGIGIYTHEILKRMVLLMPNDEFFFLFDRPFDKEFIYANNVTPIVVTPAARHPFLWYWRFEYSLPSILKKYQIDVFFSPDGYTSLSTTIPRITTIHDIAFEYFPKQIPFLVRKYYTHFTPKFCQQSNTIIAVSRHTSKDLQKKYGISQNKISVVYNGCDIDFKPLEPDEQQHIRDKYTSAQPFFIFVGAIHPRKNPLGILKAFEIFKERAELPHKMLFVGRKAWHIKEFEKAMKTHRFAQDIIHIENIERKEIPKLLASSTALLYPSFYEGFGLPVLEAMACGTPSITSEHSPMTEIGKDAVMAVHPDSPGEMAGMMLGLATNPTMRKMLAIKGIMRREGFWWDEAAESIAKEIRLLYLQK